MYHLPSVEGVNVALALGVKIIFPVFITRRSALETSEIKSVFTDNSNSSAERTRLILCREHYKEMLVLRRHLAFGSCENGKSRCVVLVLVDVLLQDFQTVKFCRVL